jgi:hypothetical protein
MNKFPISELFAGRGFSRRRHAGCQFVGFQQERRELARWHDTGLDREFELKRSLKSFFLDGCVFGNEFSLAAGAARSPVIRRNRACAANSLFCRDVRSVIVCFQFGWVHGAKLQTKSAIGHRPSAILR